MKCSKGSLFIAAIFYFGLILSSSQGFGEEAKDEVLAKMTMKRWADPVVVDAGLAKDLIGCPISNLRVYAYVNGSFQPIRYQIDEMTGKDGDWVLTTGKITNTDMGNGKLDTWDTVSIYVSDLGDRVAKGTWVDGYTKGTEIEVIDPLTGEKGWCYLLYFASNPPARSTLPDYQNYHHQIGVVEGDTTEYWFIDCIITPDKRATTYYKTLKISEKAGGNNASWPDRLKIRTEARLFFGTVPIRFTEELLKSDTIGAQSGPVRLIRRVEQYIEIKGIKVFRFVSDIMAYRNMVIAPCVLQVPIKPNTVVSSIVMRFANDYSPAVLESKTCLASDPNHWYQINGKMDPDEINFSPKTYDQWRLTTGEFGTVMFNNIFPEEIMPYIKITRGIIDDVTHKDPPETYPGCIGMAYQNWDLTNVPRGRFLFFLNFYFPVKYKPGDEVQYVNLTDNPVKIKVGSSEGLNQALRDPKLCKAYR
jgi:hypothetical protein